jgi:hypothetical protein
MNISGLMGVRRLGLAATVTAATLAMGLATASPAAASSAGFAWTVKDTLFVVGTSHGDQIALRLAAGATDTLEVDFGDDGSADRSFDRDRFSRIAVFAGSGNDRFRVDQVNGAFADEAITVYGGSGNDALDGGDGVERFFGGSGRDAVDGNRGNDTAYLGSGRDSFRWDPGDGSDVVEGDSGTDTLDFNGAAGVENMSLEPNGRRSLFLRDAGNIRMDMDNVERLDLTALEAVDTVTVEDMSGTDFRRADVDLSAAAGGGDAAADVVTVNGTADDDEIDVEARGARVDVEGLQTKVRVTGSETIDSLQINTLDGDDDVDVDDDVEDLIGVVVDLGADQ